MPLKSEVKTKTRSSHPCKECGVDIPIGEEYTSVMYSDGFRTRLHGAFHHNCWKISADNPKNKPKIAQ